MKTKNSNPLVSTIVKALHLLLLVTFAVTSQAAVESTTYIITDHLGSPILATDEDGQVKWQEDYQPYGTQIIREDTDNTVGFTGHRDDKTLDVTYMQGRWYHPEMGRFMAIDPVGFVEGNPQSFNRYTYANNNPYKFVDPDGEYATVEMLLDPYGLRQMTEASPHGYVGAGGVYDDGSMGVVAQSLIAAELIHNAFDFGVNNTYRPPSPISGISLGPKSTSVSKELAGVPGRVQSRINLSNDGIAHTIRFHFNPAKAGNKSQFTLPVSELRSLLSAKSTVQAPAKALETGNFARTITTNRTVGNLAEKMGGGSTNTFTVITDKFGNLQTAFPGEL